MLFSSKGNKTKVGPKTLTNLVFYRILKKKLWKVYFKKTQKIDHIAEVKKQVMHILETTI